MTRRSVKPRLLALVVVFLVGLGYISFAVLGYRLGKQPYSVTVQVTRSGGVYKGASVTYRGVEVGRVSATHIRGDHVDLSLRIKPSIHIPAGAHASITDLSAAGEPYVDFVPATAGPPFLHDGSIVPVGQTSTPVAIGTLLSDVSRLVASINPGDVRTIADELATGLSGTGNALRAIVADSRMLLAQLGPVEPATLNLLTNGHTLLTTANDTDQQMHQLADGLATITDQLKRSDDDLRTVIATGPSVTEPSHALITAVAADFRAYVVDAAKVTLWGSQRIPAFNALLDVLPGFGRTLASIVQDGRLRVFVYLNTKDPVCTYVPNDQIPLPTKKTAGASLTNDCSIAAPTLLQRGAADAPRP